jgi:hypothetical protein
MLGLKTVVFLGTEPLPLLMMPVMSELSGVSDLRPLCTMVPTPQPASPNA